MVNDSSRDTYILQKSREKSRYVFGYSANYENEKAMLKTAKDALSLYSPRSVLINIGATSGGIGAAYPVAREMGFVTTGIVSSVAIEHLDNLSNEVFGKKN